MRDSTGVEEHSSLLALMASAILCQARLKRGKVEPTISRALNSPDACQERYRYRYDCVSHGHGACTLSSRRV